jgi:hypothetical protein
MKQGFSGSTVRQVGDRVEKISSDETFSHSKERQDHLVTLSRHAAVLPRIYHIKDQVICMEYVQGEEGLTRQSAYNAGQALRKLHSLGGDYPYPCMTGLEWLIALANENLAQLNAGQRVNAEIGHEYPLDALIHSEPVQLLHKQDGSIVFIDIEGIGLGSRYQDLGFVYYCAIKENQPDLYDLFMQGYLHESDQVELSRVKHLAGIISFAYACFADFAYRMDLGFQLCGEAGVGMGG